MFKELFCWFIGHKPRGPVMALDLEGYEIAIYKCERCEHLIVFDSTVGWEKWD